MYVQWLLKGVEQKTKWFISFKEYAVYAYEFQQVPSAYHKV